MFKLFKSKKVEAQENPQNILVDYILKLRSMNLSDDLIKLQLEKSYPRDFVDYLFLKLNNTGGKMVKQEVEVPEEDDLDVTEDATDEDLEEQEAAPVRQAKPQVKVKVPIQDAVREKPKAQPEVTLTQAVQAVIELERRVAELEATFYRLKSI